MKSKIFLLILSLVITISAVAGATYAWFTDSETNTANAFTTGTVDIEVDRENDYVPGPMFYTTAVEGQNPDGLPGANMTQQWYPGYSATRQLEVRNMGSLEVRLHQLGAEITSLNGADPSTLPALAASFAENMFVRIYKSQNEILYNGTLADLLLTQPCSFKPKILPSIGGQHPRITLNFEVTMSESSGNDLQGIKPVVSFWVGAEQTKNNP